MWYTRKGDSGSTSVFGCDQRLSKSSAIAEALGALDEANSYIGLCKAFARSGGDLRVPDGARSRSLAAVLHGVQEVLFTVQAEIAGAQKRVPSTQTKRIERVIDAVERALPPIHTFIVPGASLHAAHLDCARTLVRRAERRVVAVHEEGVQRVGAHALAYLNRLSSLLFALARYVNFAQKIEEESPRYT